MGQHSADVNDLAIKSHHTDEPVLVSTQVEHDMLTHFVDRIESRLEFCPIAEPIAFNDAPPALERVF